MTNSLYGLASLCGLECRLLGVESEDDVPTWMTNTTWDNTVTSGGYTPKTPTTNSANAVRGQLDGKSYSGFNTIIELIAANNRKAYELINSGEEDVVHWCVRPRTFYGNISLLIFVMHPHKHTFSHNQICFESRL